MRYHLSGMIKQTLCEKARLERIVAGRAAEARRCTCRRGVVGCECSVPANILRLASFQLLFADFTTMLMLGYQKAHRAQS